MVIMKLRSVIFAIFGLLGLLALVWVGGSGLGISREMGGKGEVAAKPLVLAKTKAPVVFGTQVANPEDKGKPARYLPPKGKEDLASTQEREAFLQRARIIQERATKPDAQGNFTRKRLVEAVFKYPKLRVEESWQRDAASGKEQMLEQLVMVADHYLVTLREGVDHEAFELVVSGLGGNIRRHVPNSRVYLVGIGGADLDLFEGKLVEFREKAAPMEIVEPDYVVFTSAVTPNDPSFSSLWGLHNTGQTGGSGDADIDAPDAWEASKGSSSVVVGVIDTGIDYTHPDLAANMWLNADEVPGNGRDDDNNGYIDDTRGWDFVGNDNNPMDDQYHGTHCAGTIGAVGGNGIGVVGVCHTVRLMALKFISGSSGGTISDAIEAILYATANQATLTSNSWGGGGYSQTLKNAIDAAGTAGLLFVAAAGNEAKNADSTPAYPAAYNSANIISVAATDHRDALASFSNYGAVTVDLAAPGVSIYSTAPANTYRSLSGTSMACPHVAGACALIKAARPTMNWSDVKNAILGNVDGVAGLTGKVATKGRMNLARALIIAAEPQLALTGVQVSDNGLLGSSGNNDGLINPGENIAVAVTLKNLGITAAQGVSSTLTVTSTGNKVSVVQGTRSWGIIAAGGTVTSGSTPFIIRIAADTVTPHEFTLNLSTKDSAGSSWTAQAKLSVLTGTPVSGQVTALTGGAGISGATISYTGPASGTVTANASGNYSVSLTNGTYEFKATAAGYDASTIRSVTIPPSATGVNFVLGRSEVVVSPTSLTATLNEDTTTTKTITVTNRGDQPLRFTAGTAPPASPLSSNAASVSFLPPLIGSATDAAAETNPAGERDLMRIASGSTTLPFMDSFESGNFSDWTSDLGSGTRQVVSDMAAEGTKSFLYAYGGEAAHFQGIHRDFADGTRPRSVSFWVRSDSTMTDSGYFVLTDSTYGDDLIWFFTRSNGRLFVNGENGGDESIPYQANVWYRVEFRDMNWVAKNFDYYVNGTLVKANIPFRNADKVDEVSQVWLYNFSAEAKAWWDDIRFMDASLDWLTVAPEGGTLAPGQSSTLTVSFNALEKTAGDYLGQVEISSNDPVNPVMSVPVTMTVLAATNTPPVATAQSVTFDEDTQRIITLTGTDAEGHALTAQIQTLPALGSLYQTMDGLNLGERITSVPATVANEAKKVIFVPPPNANGTPYTTFQFIMRDRRSQSAVATVTLNVTSVNDQPVAFNDQFSGLPGAVITPISVLANDVEPDGQTLTISSFTQGQRGSVAANGDGTLRFTPSASFTSGSDSFSYTVSDGAGGTATALVSVSAGLLAGGAWPMMGRDAAHTGFYPGTLNEQTFSLAWSLKVAPQPLNQVSIAEGKVFATPDILYNETQLSAVDLVTGTLVWKKVWPMQARSINGPSYHAGQVYVQRTSSSSGTDEPEIVSLNAATGAQSWRATFSAQADKYLPPTITDSAVYVNGGTYGGMYGYNRSTGTQLFYNAALEQYDRWTPTFFNGTPYSYVAGKLRQHHATTGIINWTVTVGATGSGRVAVMASNAAFMLNSAVTPNELVCVDLTTQAVRWRAAGGFSGTPAVAGSRVYAFDSTGNVKAYDINAGTLQQTYTTGIGTGSLYQPIITNDVLIACSTNNTAIHTLTTGTKIQAITTGGIPSLSNGQLLLAGTDGNLRCYSVQGGNTAPVATAETSTCIEDQTATLTLNGTDVDGNSLLALVTELPSKGTLFQTSDGVQLGDAISLVPVIVRNPQRKVIYRPAVDGSGSPYATFKFKVNDGMISSTEATATVNVTNVNDAPLAVNDTVYLRSGSILAAYAPTANDRDADNETLTITSFTQPTKGTLTQNGNGTLRYVPQATFTDGTDSFQYTLQDGSGITSSATVQVLVSAAYGAEWSQYGNGADHSGRYPGALGSQTWVPRWDYYFPSAINSVAIGGGKVYITPTGNWNNYMYAVALDAETGAEVWRRQFQPGRSMNPPSYHKGVIYTQRGNSGSDTHLWALNANDGSVKWSTPHGAQNEWYFSPAVTDLGVYINGGTYGGIYGFNHLTGTQKFFLTLEQKDKWTPTIHEGKVYSFVSGMFRNHYPETGAVQWSLNLTWNSSDMNRTICCDSGRAYITNDTIGGAELICIDLQSQGVAWRVKGSFYGTPAVSNGIVYACHAGMVKAYNGSAGNWIADFTATGESTLTGAPVVSSDLLFIGSSSKTFIFDLATRGILQTLNFGSTIALADDTLYLAGIFDNRVRAYGRAVPSNQLPVALAAQADIHEEAEAALTLEGTDGDGEALRYVIRTLPAQGTLYQTSDGSTKGAAITLVPAQVLNPNGRVIYQSPLNVFGNDVGSFTFTAQDRIAASAPATVIVHVSPVNDAPIAVTDHIALRPGETLTNFRPQANDRDADSDTLTITTFTQGTKGVVSQSADGSLQYVPNATFTTGTDTFAYTIRDAANIVATGTVNITVNTTLGRAWPTFGASAEHTGFLPIIIGSSSFTQRWQKDLTKAAHQLAVSDGKVVASLKVYAENSSIVALDQSTGAELWRTNFLTPSYMNPPTWHEGSVFFQYTNSGSSKLYKLSGTNGATTWQAPFTAQSEQYLAPAIDSTGVFVNGGMFGGLYGFNLTSGAQTFFNSTLEQVAQWTPTLHNGGLYSFIRGRVRSHNKTTGVNAWTLDLGTSMTGYSMARTTAAADGYLYLINDVVSVPAGDQEITRVNLTTQTVSWRVRGRFIGTPALAHQAVFAISGSTGDSIRSYDTITGEPVGIYRLPASSSGLHTQPIITNDSVIAASTTATYLFDLTSRTLRQSIAFGGNISLAGNTLYIASADGIIRAFGVSDVLNRPPTAIAQTVTTNEDTRVTVSLQGADADNDTLTFAITTLPTLGTLHQTTDGVTAGALITTVPTLVTHAQGKVVYQPPADRNGTALASFQFAASDGKANSVATTGTVNVQAVNDAPLARADTRMAQPGQILSPVREVLNDFDADGDALTITAFTQPSIGTVVQNADGTLRYHAPAEGFENNTQFSYTIRDAAGATSTAQVIITLQSHITGEWSTFGNGPAHTGYASSALGRSGWASRWVANAASSGSSLQPIASSGGSVFVTYKDSASSYITALDINNGAALWSRSFAAASSMNPPTYHAGHVYVQRGNHSADTQLIALHAGTGLTAWTVPYAAQWQSYMAPAVSDLGVFVNGGSNGGVYGFGNATGTQLFFATKPQTESWTPAILGSELYTFTNGNLVRHHPSTGDVLWTQALGWGGFGSQMHRTVALEGRRAFLINDSPSATYSDEDLVCIHLDTQAIVWSINGEFTGTPATASGVVFAISSNTVQARSAVDGNLLGTYSAPPGVYLTQQPIITDDLVIAASDSNTYLFGRYDSVLLQTLPRGGHIAVVDDALLISSPATATLSAWAAQPAITFSPPGGYFASSVSVIIGAADPGTRIHYTVDGTAPDFTSPWLVSGSTVTMNWTGKIRAISVKGADVSRIHEASYTLADADNDGLADWWETQHFGGLATATATSDRDGDGVSDRDEFDAGTHPLSGADSFTVESAAPPPSAPQDEFILRWSSKIGRLYVVETSANLSTWQRATPVMAGTGNEMEHCTRYLSTQRLFSRVRVLPALLNP